MCGSELGYLQRNLNGFPVAPKEVENCDADDVAPCIDALVKVEADLAKAPFTLGEGQFEEVAFFVVPHLHFGHTIFPAFQLVGETRSLEVQLNDTDIEI
jgi:hypothetical protein